MAAAQSREVATAPFRGLATDAGASLARRHDDDGGEARQDLRERPEPGAQAGPDLVRVPGRNQDFGARPRRRVASKEQKRLVAGAHLAVRLPYADLALLGQPGE